jgi:hypothetical protein
MKALKSRRAQEPTSADLTLDEKLASLIDSDQASVSQAREAVARLDRQTAARLDRVADPKLERPKQVRSRVKRCPPGELVAASGGVDG